MATLPRLCVCLSVIVLSASFFRGSAQADADIGCKSASEWAKRSIYFLLTDRFAKDPGSNNDACGDLFNSYCGGTFKGIQSKLDYIAGMGFDAIWITPIMENTDRGYHGYWAKNWFAVNKNYGSEEDFKELVSAAQSKSIWVMLDLALNHMGNAPIDQLWPFNRREHYHEKCDIGRDSYDFLKSDCSLKNAGNVENCRLADLPDLNQDNSYVQQKTEELIKKVTTEYKVNGLRLDAIKHMRRDYLKNHVTDKTECFTIGEALLSQWEEGCLLRKYQTEGSVDGVLNFVMQEKLKKAFRTMEEPVDNIGKTYRGLLDIKAQPNDIKPWNPAINGLFIDNHDNVAGGCRWLGLNPDKRKLYNALGYVFTGTGIPILYYGTEQGYAGQGGTNDGGCREPLWTGGYNQGSDIYKFIATLNRIRKTCSIWDYEETLLSEGAGHYAFRRGDLFVFLTNRVGESIQLTVNAGLLPVNTKVCNVFDPRGKDGDCAYVFVGGDRNRYFTTNVFDLPKVFVPVDYSPSTCGGAPIRVAAKPQAVTLEAEADWGSGADWGSDKSEL